MQKVVAIRVAIRARHPHRPTELFFATVANGGVVDDAGVAEFAFDRPDITGCIDRQRDREIAEDGGVVGA